MEKSFKIYLETIKSENTRRGTETIGRLLEKYMKLSNINSVNNIGQAEIDIFLKRNCEGKSDKTVSNMLSKSRGYLGLYDNEFETIKNIKAKD